MKPIPCCYLSYIYTYTYKHTTHTYIYTYVWYIHSWYKIYIHLYSTIYVDVYSTISCNMGGFTFSFFDKTMLWFQAWREKQVKINLSLKRVWQPRFSNDKDMISTGFLWLRTTIFMLHDMVYLFFFKGKTQFSMDEEQTQLLDLMLVYRSLRVRKPHTMDISTRNIHKIDDLSTINPKFGLMINQLTSRFGFPSCMVSRRLEETWWSVSCFFSST